MAVLRLPSALSTGFYGHTAVLFRPCFQRRLQRGGYAQLKCVAAVPTIADDRELPGSLEDAIQQSAQSTSKFLASGGKRAIVELAIAELDSLDIDGGQQKLWDCSRLFLMLLQEQFVDKQFKAVFPDAGAAALLKYRWSDATFLFGSLNDRRPVAVEDEIIVLVSPDYQMLDEVQKIANSLVDGDGMQEKPLIMWNPRLVSGEVGVGLTVRRLRNRFLSTFTTAYCLKSYAVGAIFKRYPGLWQIYLEVEGQPGRYALAGDQVRRPSEDDLERCLLAGSAEDGESGQPQGPSPSSVMAVLSSLGRFMKSLSQ